MEGAQEITAEELKGMDLSQVASLQLKDGTLVIINEGEGEAQQEYQAEEIPQDENTTEYVECQETKAQTNNLRARPYYPMAPVAPKMVPVRPVVPMKPIPPKPLGVPTVPIRGPMKPMVAPRPGYGVVPVRPVAPMRPVVPVRPVVPMKPTVMPRPVPVFRAKPVAKNEEVEEQMQEENFQEEQYEDQYCECGQEQQYTEETDTKLRARPYIGMPMVPPMHHKPHIIPPRPVVPMVPVAPRRGPVAPMGYNTFQPRVFRARPRRIMPVPMFTPLVGTYQPRVYGYGRPMMHPMRRPMMSPLFRSKPRSSSFDKAENQEYMEECVEQNECNLNTEGNVSKTCTKCGKKF